MQNSVRFDKVSILTELQKMYPEIPADVLIDLFRPTNKHYFKAQLPDLSGNFQYTHPYISKIGFSRMIQFLKMLTPEEWDHITSQLPICREIYNQYRNRRSKRKGLERFHSIPGLIFARVAEIYSHVNVKKNTINIVVTHVRDYETGDALITDYNDHVSINISVPTKDKFQLQEGDFIVFKARSYNYKSGGQFKWALNCLWIEEKLSLAKAREWWNDLKFEKTLSVGVKSSAYGKPKTYSMYYD